jgi:hypothetical protein
MREHKMMVQVVFKIPEYIDECPEVDCRINCYYMRIEGKCANDIGMLKHKSK